MSNTPVVYEAGFLEEAASSGMSFINAPADNQICIIKLFGPPAALNQANLSYIVIDPEATSPGKFKCEIRSTQGLLFNHTDFINNSTEELLSEDIVHGLVKGNNNCFLTYSVKVNRSLSTPPAEASTEDEILVLSPFALEPYVGDVALSVTSHDSGSELLDYSSSTGSNGLVTFTEGYNYDLSTSSDFSQLPTFSFSPVAGAGLGRQPCEDEVAPSSNDLISINGIVANEQGQFYITTNPGSCINIDSLESAHKISINSHCPPCCRCADYVEVQKFLRSYVVMYAKMAKQYFELESEYNSINAQFKNQLACCPTFDAVVPRVRIWPQHNFKVQIQGMLQNNKKVPVCLCSVKMTIRVSLPEGFTIQANEVVTNPDGTTTTITHQMTGMPNGTRLAIVPIQEASYVYFKNVNPGNQVVIDTSSGDGENVGFMSVTINLLGGDDSLPVGNSDCEENSTSVGPNCMDPCEGYNMLTGGFAIVDPLFRKILNLNPAYAAEGVNVNADIVITYEGTNNDPCALCSPQSVYDQRRTIRVKPNRVALNPCQSIKMQGITVEPPNPETGTPIKYYATFPEEVRVSTGVGQFTVTVKAFIPESASYQTISTQTLNFEGGAARVDLPDPLDPLSGAVIPPGASGIIMTVETDGQNMYTLCAPNPNSPADTVQVALAPSSVGYSLRLQ